MSVTLGYLQKYIRAKDYSPELADKYFMKLAEEVGELSRAIRKNYRMECEDVKGTLEEELWDVIYYTLALANVYDVDIETVIPLKENLNREKYGDIVRFGDPLE